MIIPVWNVLLKLEVVERKKKVTKTLVSQKQKALLRRNVRYFS